MASRVLAWDSNASARLPWARALDGSLRKISRKEVSASAYFFCPNSFSAWRSASSAGDGAAARDAEKAARSRTARSRTRAFYDRIGARGDPRPGLLLEEPAALPRRRPAP